MRFDLTDEQKSLRDMLTDFFHDRLGGAQAVEAVEDAALDAELWSAISELGLAGAMVPEADGGLGLDLLTAAVIAEITGYFTAPVPIIPSIIGAWLIATAGTAAQKEKWLPAILTQGAQVAFALAEEDGWRPDHWTLAADHLTGSCQFTGAKQFVERANSADIFIVGGADGLLAIVEAGRAEVTPIETLDRSRPLFDVAFDQVDFVILARDAHLTERLFDALCVCAAADSLGAASAIQARAVDYAKERKQYGQLIGSFQALKHQLADMSVELEPARPLVWYAAHAWDMEQDDTARMAALAKAHLTDISVNVARMAIEAHGGIGYTWEHPAHLFLKRAMADRATLGNVNAHRERAAALAGW